MPRQSVEGIFDEATDAAVRRRWAVLAEAGLPSQASHRGQSNSPHLTLSVAERLPAAVEQSLVELATGPGSGLALECRLGPLVLLGGRRLVVAHLVVPSEPLLRLQSAVAAAMAGGEGVADPELSYLMGMARALRLADGPDEVHRAMVARLELGKYS